MIRTQGGRVGSSRSTGRPGYSSGQMYLEDKLMPGHRWFTRAFSVKPVFTLYRCGFRGSCSAHSVRSHFLWIQADSRTLRWRGGRTCREDSCSIARSPSQTCPANKLKRKQQDLFIATSLLHIPISSIHVAYAMQNCTWTCSSNQIRPKSQVFEI